MQQATRDPKFAAKLALAYGEILDGIRPALQRVSLRISGDAANGELELRNSQTNTVEFWRLSELRLVPDQANADALVLARSESEVARLIVRDRAAVLEILNACPDLPDLGSGKRGLPQLIGLGVAAFASIAAILFVLIPFMADRGADFIPVDAEVAFGQSSFEQISTALNLSECKSQDGDAALNQMQARITQGLDLPYALQLRVVNSPEINAFALPGGLIAINRGLIDVAETPQEVAAVLAHEIGHVVHRDGTRSMLRTMGSFGIIGLVFGDAVGISAAAGVSQRLISSSHSREAEIEADAFAHRQLTLAGLPPAAMAQMFNRMEERGLGGEMGVFRHISSHPDLRARIDAANAADAGGTTGAPVISAVQWQALQRICN